MPVKEIHSIVAAQVINKQIHRYKKIVAASTNIKGLLKKTTQIPT